MPHTATATQIRVGLYVRLEANLARKTRLQPSSRVRSPSSSASRPR